MIMKRVFYEKGCHTNHFHEKGCHTNHFHEKGCQDRLKRRMAKYNYAGDVELLLFKCGCCSLLVHLRLCRPVFTLGQAIPHIVSMVYMVEYVNLPRCPIIGCSVGRTWLGVYYPHHLRCNWPIRRQGPCGIPFREKNMTIGIPFCDKKV